MKTDPRRTLCSLAIAAAMLAAMPWSASAQITTDTPSAADDGAVSGTVEGSAGGGMVVNVAPPGLLILPDQRGMGFLRDTVTANALDIELARLVDERSADPAVKQFAEVVTRQSQRMMSDAASVAARNGVDAPQLMNAVSSDAVIADLSNRYGKDFDEAYLRAFIQDRRAAVAQYLAAKGTMPDDVSAYADRQLGMLWDQLRAAQELAMRLGVDIRQP